MCVACVCRCFYIVVVCLTWCSLGVSCRIQQPHRIKLGDSCENFSHESRTVVVFGNNPVGKCPGDYEEISSRGV